MNVWRRNSRGIIFIMLQIPEGELKELRVTDFWKCLPKMSHDAQIIRKSVFFSFCVYRRELMTVLSCVYNVHVVLIKLVCANLFGVSVWVQVSMHKGEQVLGWSVKCDKVSVIKTFFYMCRCINRVCMYSICVFLLLYYCYFLYCVWL